VSEREIERARESESARERERERKKIVASVLLLRRQLTIHDSGSGFWVDGLGFRTVKCVVCSV